MEQQVHKLQFYRNCRLSIAYTYVMYISQMQALLHMKLHLPRTYRIVWYFHNYDTATMKGNKKIDHDIRTLPQQCLSAAPYFHWENTLSRSPRKQPREVYETEQLFRQNKQICSQRKVCCQWSQFFQSFSFSSFLSWTLSEFLKLIFLIFTSTMHFMTSDWSWFEM